MMTAAHSTSAVVDLGDGSLGILTDRDLRTRVVAEGLTGEAPVSAVMSAPAYTCPPDRLGGDVLLDMLDRGLRHFPVVSATGSVLGVVEDIDLRRGRGAVLVLPAPADRPSPERRRADRCRPRAAPDGARAARRSRRAGERVRRLLGRRRRAHAAAARARARPSRVTSAPSSRGWRWAARRGARRCRAPTSTARSCGSAPGRGRGQAAACTSVARPWSSGSRPAACAPTTHGATASDPRFVRSLDSWQRAARSWIADPTQEKALVLVSVLVDSRPVWGDPHRDAGGRQLPPRAGQPGAAAPAGSLRAFAPPADRLPARTRGRVKRRASRPARPQARRRAPDRRPGPLGRHGGGRDQRVDERAATRGRRGRNACSETQCPDAGGRTRADHGPAAGASGRTSCGPGRSPTTTSIRPTLTRLTRSYLREAFRAVASIQKRRRRASSASAFIEAG